MSPRLCDRLEEYVDGEVSDRDAADFKAHLGTCEPCTREIAELEKLNELLKRSPSESPRADYVERVVARARRRSIFRVYGTVLAVAASVLVGFFVVRISTPSKPAEPYGEEQAFRDGLGDAGARTRAIAWFQGQGPAGEKLLLAALTQPAIERQKAAGLIIASLDTESRERMLAAHVAAPIEREWELQPIGGDLTDVELVGYALQLARSDRTFDEAAQILKKLSKDGVNRSAHNEIVRSLKEMFGSGQEPAIRAAFRVAERLELLIEDVVEFLDVPDLGDRALDFLKQRTGQDFGRDKAKWREHLNPPHRM